MCIRDRTYIRKPTFLEGMTMTPPAPIDLAGVRVLALLGDSITTDHISPAGSIKADSPAGKYLIERGVKPSDFNSYGARRELVAQPRIRKRTAHHHFMIAAPG